MLAGKISQRVYLSCRSENGLNELERSFSGVPGPKKGLNEREGCGADVESELAEEESTHRVFGDESKECSHTRVTMQQIPNHRRVQKWSGISGEVQSQR